MVGEERSSRIDTSKATNYDTALAGPISGGDDFGRRIARTAAAQICDSVGFDSASISALDALADVTVRFIRDLGRSASSCAVLSGRASSNELDIIQGLEDLGFGAHRHCLVGSDVLRGIVQFVKDTEEVPFAAPIPRFPVTRSVKKAPSFAQIGEEPQKKHIPNWLPAFPDPHTYIFTPMWNERSSDARMDKLEQARQRRKGEQSLLSLQKRIIHNGSSRFVAETADGDDGNEKQVVVANDVGKKLTAVSAFEPVIDAARSGGGFESGDEERRVIYKRRPGSLHFKYGVEKRSLVLPSSYGGRGIKNDGWFLRDDEKDDKKRRAEMILKESMENPQELMQL